MMNDKENNIMVDTEDVCLCFFPYSKKKTKSWSVGLFPLFVHKYASHETGRQPTTLLLIIVITGAIQHMIRNAPGYTDRMDLWQRCYNTH